MQTAKDRGQGVAERVSQREQGAADFVTELPIDVAGDGNLRDRLGGYAGRKHHRE